MAQEEKIEGTPEAKFREMNLEDFKDLSSAPRRRAREAALIAAFHMDIGGGSFEQAAGWFEDLGLSPENQAFARALVENAAKDREQVDAMLSKYARGWQVSRFAGVDRCILRLAVGEMLHPIDTPVTVVINEAIELAKKFSAADSAGFINGILDNVYAHEFSAAESEPEK
ncbi:MAG: transcription antitermination factor NusB [Firmicutes bacterium]|nr:transcription antitermination factor NusB [Bacillota bacterium]